MYGSIKVADRRPLQLSDVPIIGAESPPAEPEWRQRSIARTAGFRAVSDGLN